MGEGRERERKDNSDEQKKLMDSMAEFLNILSGKGLAMPSIGPIQTAGKQAAAVSNELAGATKALATYNNHLAQYYVKIGSTWMEAAKKSTAKCQQADIGQDMDKIQQIWIDTLEEEFTKLFSMEDFAVVGGELLKSESEVNRYLSNIVEIYSQNLRIPTRSEINDIYDEITKMKRTLKKISDRVERIEHLAGGDRRAPAAAKRIER